MTKFFSRYSVYNFIKRVLREQDTSPRNKQIIGPLSEGSDRDVTASQFSRVSERITLDNVKTTLFEAPITYAHKEVEGLFLVINSESNAFNYQIWDVTYLLTPWSRVILEKVLYF